jgi:hypothetical protein
VGHELDGENIGMVARTNTRIQSEGLSQRRRIVLPDVLIFTSASRSFVAASYDTSGGGSPDQVRIIGAGSEECTASRPAGCRVRR